jgi:hypothetical protein
MPSNENASPSDLRSLKWARDTSCGKPRVPGPAFHPFTDNQRLEKQEHWLFSCLLHVETFSNLSEQTKTPLIQSHLNYNFQGKYHIKSIIRSQFYLNNLKLGSFCLGIDWLIDILYIFVFKNLFFKVKTSSSNCQENHNKIN